MSSQPALERRGQVLRGVLPADERADGPDHAQDFREAPLVERHHRVSPPNQLGGDVRLQIGEGENQVRLQRLDLVEAGVDERRHLGLAPGLRRTHGVARDPDDAVPFAEQIQRLGGFLGEADDAMRILSSMVPLGSTGFHRVPQGSVPRGSTSSRGSTGDPRGSASEPAELRTPRTLWNRTQWNPAEPRGTLRNLCHCYTSIMRSAAVLVMICSLVVAADAQSQRRRPAPRKPPPPPPLQTEPADVRCPETLGTGVKTGAVFCFVLAGRDPAEGVLVAIPPHTGPATLLFDIHNRHTYSDEDIRAGRGFAKYTAVIGVLTLKGELLAVAPSRQSSGRRRISTTASPAARARAASRPSRRSAMNRCRSPFRQASIRSACSAKCSTRPRRRGVKPRPRAARSRSSATSGWSSGRRPPQSKR